MDLVAEFVKSIAGSWIDLKIIGYTNLCPSLPISFSWKIDRDITIKLVGMQTGLILASWNDPKSTYLGSSLARELKLYRNGSYAVKKTFCVRGLVED